MKDDKKTIGVDSDSILVNQLQRDKFHQEIGVHSILVVTHPTSPSFGYLGPEVGRDLNSWR